MARRHEVQNLIRRGNVFYWRPRVPRQFSRIANSHLSLSLHHSCYMKAGYMVRRLNTLLHEMKMKPMAALTTKEQLEALFRTEAARMGDHLDNLQFAARRTGTDPLLALRADLEVGWSYRLIELFGTMRHLDFSANCPGRKILEREGIPEGSIAVIAETFAQEQAECRRVPFEKALRADMAEQGLPDTLVNRERATAELMRARADMLLASPSRYPEMEGLQLTQILGHRDEETWSPTADDISAAKPATTSAPFDPHVDRGEDILVQSSELERTRAHDHRVSFANQDVEIGSAPSVAEQPDAIANFHPVARSNHPEGQPLPISEFSQKCEALIRSKRTWEAKTAQDVRVVVDTFAAILVEYGVSDISEIEQFHVGKLREHFDGIPARYGQSARMRQLSPKQLREAGAQMVETAKARRQPLPQIGLGTNTIRKHLGNLAEFFRYLRGHGYALRELSMDGLRPPKLKSSDIRTLTEKPDPERLRPMFKIPVFTGCLNAENPSVKGKQVYHCANYFVPMLLTYLGTRRNEITGLAARDIVETQNGWAIDIRINQFRRIKNAQSFRTLPVPDEVLRLGFIPYVQAIRDLGYQALFPELHHPEKSNDHGDRFYDDFKPLVEASDDVETWDRFLHALRHGHADALKQAGVSPELINDISGRLNKDETSVRYTNVAGLPLIRALLAKYPNITEHLEPAELRLLPWVAKRQPAPWTRMTREKRLEYGRKVRSQSATLRKQEG